LSELCRLRFNTVGNWSEWEFAAKVGFPYVVPMNFKPVHVSQIYRDFPDVFHPEFAQDAAEYASILKETAKDPALIGYFMMNEPQWGFSKELPAVGMMFNTPECETRKALSQFLRININQIRLFQLLGEYKPLLMLFLQEVGNHPF